MSKIIHRAPRQPQWWYWHLLPGSIVERDGQNWTRCSVFGDRRWRKSEEAPGLYD